MTVLLELNQIECRYHSQTVVKDLNLQVEKGALVGLLGPSGCGKTTALRAIAGFEPVYHGSIELRGETVSRPGYSLAPEKRKLSMVFQDYALFPHLNVIDNVCFGLHQLEKPDRRKRAHELLDMVGLDHKIKMFPHELSGGQQQRISLARALAPKPDVILMDEPFSSLDVERREELSVKVRDILKSMNITGIIVTHDQHEAFALSDLVGVMKEGQIVQWDTPYNLYHQPDNRFVADFIGQGKFLQGTLISNKQIETEVGIIKSNKILAYEIGSKVDVLLRPDDVINDPKGDIVGEIIQKAFKGAEILYTLLLPTGGTLLTLFPSHQNHEIGDRINIRIDAEHLVAFPV